MVGLVVVSHSPELARAAVSLALQMVQGPAPRIEIAAGTSDDRFGTDAVRVADAVVAADDGDGVVVIMDLGSAVLSAELAVDLLPDPGSEPGWSRLPSLKGFSRPSSQRPRVGNSMKLLAMPRRLCGPKLLSLPSHRLRPRLRRRLSPAPWSWRRRQWSP
jgi:PTS system fructose IIA component